MKRAPVVAVDGAGEEDEGLLGGGDGGGGEGAEEGGGLLLLEVLLLLPLETPEKTLDKLSSALCSSGENCKSLRRAA